MCLFFHNNTPLKQVSPSLWLTIAMDLLLCRHLPVHVPDGIPRNRKGCKNNNGESSCGLTAVQTVKMVMFTAAFISSLKGLTPENRGDQSNSFNPMQLQSMPCHGESQRGWAVTSWKFHSVHLMCILVIQCIQRGTLIFCTRSM